MESQKVGNNVDITKSKDLYFRYLYGKSWLCTESPDTTAHYWVETKKCAEFSYFTCKFCGEVRKMLNSWHMHMKIVSQKTGKSSGYLEGAMPLNPTPPEFIPDISTSRRYQR